MKKIAIAATASITTILPPGDLRHVDGGCGRRGERQAAAPDTGKGGVADDADSGKGGDAAPRDSAPYRRC
jgi:hypothetical protein